MSPAFTGYHFAKDREELVARARTLGLTPVIEELEELTLLSSIKKTKDDSVLMNSNTKALAELPHFAFWEPTVAKNLEAQFSSVVAIDTSSNQGKPKVAVIPNSYSARTSNCV